MEMEGKMDLIDLMNDIDDITDPSSMEKIVMYVDYIQLLDQEFIELLMEKLPQMEITWEQPWYQQCRSLTRPVILNDDVKEKFRTDKITVKEIKRIRKNWKKFRKQFDIPDNLDCFARWKNTHMCRNPQAPEECVRRFVIAYLAKGLERTLYQVYKHVGIHYGSPIKGKYSLQEEKLMEVCFFHNARNAIPVLSKLLGRASRGLYKKLQEWLVGSEECTKMRWKLPLATKFLNRLIEHTGCSLDELKYKRFEKSMWLKLENDMQHPYIYLQKFWKDRLHVQIFVKKNVKINTLRRRIALKLQQSEYRAWRDIRWKEMVKEFPDGFTDSFLYRVWVRVFRKNKDYLRKSMPEHIEYALNQIPSLRNRRLKTLALDKNGNLIEMRYKENLECDT